MDQMLEHQLGQEEELVPWLTKVQFLRAIYYLTRTLTCNSQEVLSIWRSKIFQMVTMGLACQTQLMQLWMDKVTIYSNLIEIWNSQNRNCKRFIADPIWILLSKLKALWLEATKCENKKKQWSINEKTKLLNSSSNHLKCTKSLKKQRMNQSLHPLFRLGGSMLTTCSKCLWVISILPTNWVTSLLGSMLIRKNLNSSWLNIYRQLFKEWSSMSGFRNRLRECRTKYRIDWRG